MAEIPSYGMPHADAGLLPARCRPTYPELDEAPAPMRDVIFRLLDSNAGSPAQSLFLRSRVCR
jgi:hypothetical protein